MLPNELLERIAAAYEGKANAEELEALEQDLNAQPEGQTEAASYRRLWNGFAAWRSQQFRKEVSQWESEFSDHDDEEMAEWYINNSLHPDQQEHLTQRLKTDANFAKTVEQQLQLQASFSALRTEKFREQLHHWEAQQPEAKVRQLRPKWFRPLAIAASLLLLLVVGGSWYSQSNYSNTALAGKYYKVTPTGNTLGAADERAVFLKNFDQAHQELKARKHASAAILFEQLATEAPPASFSEEDLVYYQDNIDWNLIIARLGAGNTTGDFDLRLNRITQDPDHTYYNQAVLLQQDLSSLWHW